MSCSLPNKIPNRKDTMSSEDIVVNHEPAGSWKVGYITLTNTEDGVVSYGLFDNLEEAQAWAIQLRNATIQAVCAPVHNRG
jgi:hypothetical protein